MFECVISTTLIYFFFHNFLENINLDDIKIYPTVLVNFDH